MHQHIPPKPNLKFVECIIHKRGKYLHYFFPYVHIVDMLVIFAYIHSIYVYPTKTKCMNNMSSPRCDIIISLSSFHILSRPLGRWPRSFRVKMVPTLSQCAYTAYQHIRSQRKVPRDYTKHKYHCSNLVWAHGPQYAAAAAACTRGSGIGVKVAI